MNLYIYMYTCINAYSTGLKFGNINICNVFERNLLCSSSLHLFGHKYSKNSNIVKNNNSLK